MTGNGKGVFHCEVKTDLDKDWSHLTTQFSLYDMFHHIGLLSSWHTLVKRANPVRSGNNAGHVEKDLFNAEAQQGPEF